MRYAEPPTEPPEDTRVECRECDGRGTMPVEGTPHANTTCEGCDGEGLVELPQEDDRDWDYWEDR